MPANGSEGLRKDSRSSQGFLKCRHFSVQGGFGAGFRSGAPPRHVPGGAKP